MKHQFKNPHKVYFRKSICLSVFLMCLLCLGSFLVLHLRGEIAESANNIKKYESELAQLDRQIRAVDARVAYLHQPDTLKTLLDYHSLELQEPVRGQVHMVRERGYINTLNVEQPSPMLAERGERVGNLRVDLALLNLTRTSR